MFSKSKNALLLMSVLALGLAACGKGSHKKASSNPSRYRDDSWDFNDYRPGSSNDIDFSKQTAQFYQSAYGDIVIKNTISLQTGNKVAKGTYSWIEMLNILENEAEECVENPTCMYEVRNDRRDQMSVFAYINYDAFGAYLGYQNQTNTSTVYLKKGGYLSFSNLVSMLLYSTYSSYSSYFNYWGSSYSSNYWFNTQPAYYYSSYQPVFYNSLCSWNCGYASSLGMGYSGSNFYFGASVNW